MKKNVICLRFVLIAFCVISCFSYTQAQTYNLIPNAGDMEDGTWTMGNQNGANAVITFEAGSGLYGSTALKCVNSTKPSTFYVIVCEENFNLTKSKTINVSFWAKSLVAGMRVQPIVQQVSPGTEMAFTPIADHTFELTTNWKQYRFKAEVTGTTSGTQYRLRLRGYDTGTMYIDDVQIGPLDYEDVAQSGLYEVMLSQNGMTWNTNVFRNSCPAANSDPSMDAKDANVLNHFAGRSIHWAKFSFGSPITVRVRVNNTTLVPMGTVRILPSRHGVTSTTSGDVVTFTITEPGQYSVEIGTNGYKNGLILFADPLETDIPDKSDPNCLVLYERNNPLNTVSTAYNSIYFRRGVHNIGQSTIPAHIKNVYFEDGSWVYGSLLMDNNSDVKIYGRGVLSSAKMPYRTAHCVEAINGSDRITMDGLVVADPKYFAVRLLGSYNNVSYTKVIGGWVYNCDGIAAYMGSTVRKCFIWANDDAIKIYRKDITWEDIVVWQLNNGAIIQMSWGGPPLTGNVSSDVRISRLDVLRAEWDVDRFNVGLLNCVGNRYGRAFNGEYGRGDDLLKERSDKMQDWLIEDVKTENPIPLIWNITPDDWTRCDIDGLVMKNWDVQQTNLQNGFQNRIKGWSSNSNNFFDGFVFDNVRVNGGLMTNENRIVAGEMEPGYRGDFWLVGGHAAGVNHSIDFCATCGTGGEDGLYSSTTGSGYYTIACDEEICVQSNDAIVISFWAHASASGKTLRPFLQNVTTNETIDDFPEVTLGTTGNFQRHANLSAVTITKEGKYKLRFRGTAPANLHLDKVQVGRKDWLTLTNIQKQYLNTPTFLPALSSPCGTVTGITVVQEHGLKIHQSAPDILELGGANENTRYKIYSVTGNMMLSGQGALIKASTLATGIYILVTDDNERIKFVKL